MKFKDLFQIKKTLIGMIHTNHTDETFHLGDGAIVGSWFKERHRDCFNVNEEYVRQITENLKSTYYVG